LSPDRAPVARPTKNSDAAVATSQNARDEPAVPQDDVGEPIHQACPCCSAANSASTAYWSP
jgi:hypothetical protein